MLAAEASVELVIALGKVEYAKADDPRWRPAKVGMRLQIGDRLRTGARGRASVRQSDRCICRLPGNTVYRVIAPVKGSRIPGLELLRGSTLLNNRGKPNQIHIRTRTVSAAVRGTEALIRVDDDGNTDVTVFDGEIGLTNAVGSLLLRRGETGSVRVRGGPLRSPAVGGVRLVQWALHYPAVLAPAELMPDSEESESLQRSLAAYRNGNVPAAANLVDGFASKTPAGKVYVGALNLAMGRVEQTRKLLAELPSDFAPANALRRLAAAILDEPIPELPEPNSASEWLAESYRRQADANLTAALHAAGRAVELAPDFGFAHARVAELEFSFGRINAAASANRQALRLSPENASALALEGFLLTGRSDVRAMAAFEEAIRIDGTMPNGWLGRGLLKIRRGDRTGGRRDLHLASTLQPDRSLLRSYSGKAFQHEGALNSSRKEYRLAKRMDPADPTPWLYSALLLHRENRLAEAIDELERSIELNDNRAVYRSRLLLDQDQAVRSANLANIYDSVGYDELSLRLSARGAMFDYGNHAVHRNLASSFDTLRDPTRFSLRHETEWESEHLLGVLLAPVGAGTLSQNYSQNEYSRAFVTRRLGLNSSTEYFSQANEVRQRASQFGNTDQLSYAFDLDYHHQGGFRPNDSLSRVEWYTHLKWQLSPRDSVLLRAKYSTFKSGDNFQRYDPFAADPDLSIEERQEPNLWLGYHREWRPGFHTLLLGGRLVNDQFVSDGARAVQVVNTVPAPPTFDPFGAPYDFEYRSSFEIWSFEWNQIMQREKHTDIFGARYQSGEIDASSTLVNVSGIPALGGTFNDNGEGDMQRLSVYAYHNWELLDDLVLSGGLAYENLTWPQNFRRAPLTAGEFEKERFLPKLSVVYEPNRRLALRGIYAKALGGVSFDDNIRLEPTQLAGFSQSFRTLIPETFAGSVEAPDYEILGAGLDLKLSDGRYLIIEGGIRRQNVERLTGVVETDTILPASATGSTSEELDFRESILGVTLNQTMAPHWFLSAGYRFTRSRLTQGFPDIPTIPGSVAFARHRQSEADLHELTIGVSYILPRGLFARADARWLDQSSQGFNSRPSERFPQLDLIGGWIFRDRRGEIAVGVLNLTDTDYRLNPLNRHLEFQRERTIYTRLKFNF